MHTPLARRAFLAQASQATTIASFSVPAPGGPKVLWRLGCGLELASLMGKQPVRPELIPAWPSTLHEQEPVVKG
jgi:hypothetical protein